MIAGIGFCIIAGLLFAGVGVVLRRVSMGDGSTVSYYFAFSLLHTALCFAFLTRWQLLVSSPVPRAGALVLVIGLSGALSAIGMLFMTHSMGLGHSGAS